MKLDAIIDLLVATKEIWIPLATAIIGWAAQSKLVAKLPKVAREWLPKVQESNLLDAITEADTFADYTPAQRRAYVAERISRQVEHEWGLRIPTSTLNMLIEYGYLLYRQRKGGA